VVLTVTRGTDTSHLWLRELDDPAGHDLAQTEGAEFPFWSPDSRHIAFFADGKLKRIPRSGGAIQTICESQNGRGGTWSSSGVIVFAPSPFGGLSKVSADGGSPEPLTTLDASKNEASHRFPTFLPDGRTFVYSIQPAVQPNLIQHEIASLDDPKGRPLLLGRNTARYAPPGYMIFPRDLALVAQKIDPSAKQMVGDIIQLEERAATVERIFASPAVSTAADGTLVYDEPDGRPTEGVWFSRDGRPMATAFRHPGQVFFSDLSRQGDRLVLAALSDKGASATVVNLTDGTETRLIREDQMPRYVIWSPTADRVIATSLENGIASIMSFAGSGGDQKQLLSLDKGWLAPTSMAPDGTIVFDDVLSEHGLNIATLRTGAKETMPYLETPANEQGGVLSADGKLIAYSSDASGRVEV